ncbi:MAG: helix-hairpin-helix domain-containing protein [Kosmotogaceae bacterium]
MKRISPKELQIAGTAVAVLLVGLVVFLIGGETPVENKDIDHKLAGKAVYPIDINTASADMLTLLPGIGPTKAHAIVEYRSEKGLFKDPEELTNVRGIGEATLDNIRALIICYIDNEETLDKNQNDLIDINKATIDQLRTLPGIGIEKSKAIIDYRENIGTFTHPDELMRVKGIGVAIFENIKTLIYVENSETQSTINDKLNEKININIAGKDELKELPGIGDVLAQRILDYRKQFGQFSSSEEIMNVSGIGEKTYESIRELITF